MQTAHIDTSNPRRPTMQFTIAQWAWFLLALALCSGDAAVGRVDGKLVGSGATSTLISQLIRRTSTAAPDQRQADSTCMHNKRKTLIVGLDGTQGSIFYNQLTAGNLRNFQRLLGEHGGKTAICETVYDERCARSHDGNRLGARFQALGALHNDVYNHCHQWMTSPGWLSVLTGVNNDKHQVCGNDPESKDKYYYETRLQYPTLLKQAKDAGLVTAAVGAPHALASAANRLTNILPTKYSQMLYDVWYQAGIIDAECTAEPDVLATSSCNLDYRQGHLGWDPLRDYSSTVFARRHITGSDNLTPSMGGDQCADVIFAQYDMIDHAGHQHEFADNPEYHAALQVADSQFGQVLDDVEAVATLRNESWLVVVTADHGGYGDTHGRKLFFDETIPFMLATIQPAGLPTDSRIQLQNLTYPLRHFDVAPTVLGWLDLPVADNVDGSVQALPTM